MKLQMYMCFIEMWTLFKYLKSEVNYIAGVPDPPSYVSLTVSSSSSLLVKFDEPLNHNGAVVTKYKGTFLKNRFICLLFLSSCDAENQTGYI